MGYLQWCNEGDGDFITMTMRSHAARRTHPYFHHIKKTTCESNPRKRSMTKNRMAQKGAIGNLATASGYAMNANPGPKM